MNADGAASAYSSRCEAPQDASQEATPSAQVSGEKPEVARALQPRLRRGRLLTRAALVMQLVKAGDAEPTGEAETATEQSEPAPETEATTEPAPSLPQLFPREGSDERDVRLSEAEWEAVAARVTDGSAEVALLKDWVRASGLPQVVFSPAALSKAGGEQEIELRQQYLRTGKKRDVERNYNSRGQTWICRSYTKTMPLAEYIRYRETYRPRQQRNYTSVSSGCGGC